LYVLGLLTISAPCHLADYSGDVGHIDGAVVVHVADGFALLKACVVEATDDDGTTVLPADGGIAQGIGGDDITCL
jgi:hypothetical protein